MSFKQARKMKLPFTRKGLEDYLMLCNVSRAAIILVRGIGYEGEFLEKLEQMTEEVFE